jgi:hypothetical protein
MDSVVRLRYNCRLVAVARATLLHKRLAVRLRHGSDRILYLMTDTPMPIELSPHRAMLRRGASRAKIALRLARLASQVKDAD